VVLQRQLNATLIIFVNNNNNNNKWIYNVYPDEGRFVDLQQSDQVVTAMTCTLDVSVV